MNEVDLLGALIPEFAHLVGLWQQDMYHTYTVDIHSLFLVEQLRRLRRGRYASELPLATELMREEVAPFEIYLACLLHDIGKGLGGGHSQKGADMVPVIAQRMALDTEQADFVRFLVRHHLSMSQMAEQRDVNDARTILRLANLCETRRKLRSLYLLTIADIRSVSPEAWTHWKGELLERLYRNAAEWLEAGAEEEATQQFVDRTMQRAGAMQSAAKALLVAEGIDAERADVVLDLMPRRYLLRHDAAEMAAHMKASLLFRESGEPVGVYPLRPQEGEAPYWGVVVIAGDRPGLFASVTGVLTACGHDILAVDAYTTRDRLAVEVYRMRPIAGGEAEEATEVERISNRIRAVLSGREALALRPVRPAEVRPSVMRAQPPDVRIINQESDFYSIIDVATNDRPSLLYDITRTMAELGLDVVISRASTRANRAIDSFYVTDGGYKILDPERQRVVRERLLEAIHPGAA
jgi:[protein-PII] uridylyltransferase